MDDTRAIVIFQRTGPAGAEIITDLDIPLDISAGELLEALNAAYALGVDLSDEKERYLVAEHPIALLRGTKTLKEYGIHHGTTILFTGHRRGFLAKDSGRENE